MAKRRSSPPLSRHFKPIPASVSASIHSLTLSHTLFVLPSSLIHAFDPLLPSQNSNRVFQCHFLDIGFSPFQFFFILLFFIPSVPFDFYQVFFQPFALFGSFIILSPNVTSWLSSRTKPNHQFTATAVPDASRCCRCVECGMVLPPISLRSLFDHFTWKKHIFLDG